MIVVDDESGDVEGNLIMAATFTSPRDVAFMVKHGSGIVSVGMKEEDLQRLKLPLMSPDTEDEDSSAPTFTITVVPSLGDSYFLGLYKFTAPCIYYHINWRFASGRFSGTSTCLICLHRMQKLALQLEYQLRTGQRLFLPSHLPSLSQNTSEGRAMFFLSSTEMVGFLEELVTLRLL